MSESTAGEREQIDPGQPAGKSEGLEDAGSLPRAYDDWSLGVVRWLRERADSLTPDTAGDS